MKRRLDRQRRKLAEGYEAALQDAHDAGGWYSARVPVEQDQVLDAECEIERLIGRLRGSRPLPDEGLRLARDLLCERGSPLFESGAPGALRRRVRGVCEAME